MAALAILSDRERPVSLDALRQRVAVRAAGKVLLRAKLAPAVGHFARPAWVDGGPIDPAAHVVAERLPSPGGWPQLEALIDAVMSQPLDRARPLWRLHVITGFETGETLLLLTVHHSLADGSGVLDLAGALMDGAEVADPDGVALPDVGSRRRLRAVVEQAGGPFVAVGGALVALCRRPIEAGRRAVAALVGVGQLARAGRAPRSPLNGPLGPTREVGIVATELAELREVRRAFRASSSEVVVATLADAVRRLLAEEGRAAPPELRAMLSLARVRRDPGAIPGNWSTASPVTIPIGEMTAEARLAAVSAASREMLASPRPLGAALVMRALGTWLPTGLHRIAARSVYRSRWFNLIVSTVPGPVRPPRLLGAEMRTAIPLLPLAEGVGLAVGALAWSGRLMIGITTDPALANASRLGVLFEAALSDLVAAARRRLAGEAGSTTGGSSQAGSGGTAASGALALGTAPVRDRTPGGITEGVTQLRGARSGQLRESRGVGRRHGWRGHGASGRRGRGGAGERGERGRWRRHADSRAVGDAEPAEPSWRPPEDGPTGVGRGRLRLRLYRGDAPASGSNGGAERSGGAGTGSDASGRGSGARAGETGRAEGRVDITPVPLEGSRLDASVRPSDATAEDFGDVADFRGARLRRFRARGAGRTT